MLPPQSWIFLAIERNRWGGFAEGAKPRQLDFGELLFALLILGGLGLVVWAFSRMLSYYEQRRGYYGPRRLFLALCRAHRLGWREGWLLWRLARHQRLGEPARIFLEPEQFIQAMQAPAFAARTATLTTVYNRLFAMPPETKKEPTPTAPPPQPESQ
jgi:hypothetical protein